MFLDIAYIAVFITYKSGRLCLRPIIIIYKRKNQTGLDSRIKVSRPRPRSRLVEQRIAKQ